MSDKEKIGQLVMASNEHGDTEMPSEFIRKMIQDYFVGSMIVYGKRDVGSQAEYNNKDQEFAGETRLNIPLFVTADAENGAPRRVPDDATTLPRVMGIGATNSLEHARTYSQSAAGGGEALGFT